MAEGRASVPIIGAVGVGGSGGLGIMYDGDKLAVFYLASVGVTAGTLYLGAGFVTGGYFSGNNRDNIGWLLTMKLQQK